MSCTGVGADDGAFALDGNTLKINQSPDYEIKNTYDVCVRTTDSAGAFFDKHFTIEVTDINEAPVIQNATFSVAENATNATVVGTITGTDVDANTTLTYTITAGNPDSIFVIDPNTGIITVNDNTKLDYETTTSYTLTVQVSDGELTDTAIVTINVTDVDDKAPICGTSWTQTPTSLTNGNVSFELAGSTDAES